MNYKLNFLLIIFLFIFVYTCQKDDNNYQPVVDSELNLPSTPFNYATLNLPSHFTTNAPGPLPTAINGTDNTPADNPVTNQGATLGRVLFL